jgi:hypothetical protein
MSQGLPPKTPALDVRQHGWMSKMQTNKFVKVIFDNGHVFQQYPRAIKIDRKIPEEMLPVQTCKHSSGT